MKKRKLSENCGRCWKHAKVECVDYCRRCLCAVIENRVRKKLAGARGNSNRNYAVLAVVCDGKSSLQCVAAAYLAKKMGRSGFDVEIITSGSTAQLRERRGNAVVVLPKCADDIAAEFMEKFIRPKMSLGHKSCNARLCPVALWRLGSPQQLLRKISAINIFEAVTERELALYADIKNLKYAKAQGKAKGNGLKQRIQKLQARYPGTVEALARSGRRIEGFRG
ncbi:hypothetical protein HYV85_06525 [Candidatus Woesearchaeota archaeon]|nr:hypothetical protein [Candidatus Woesearchaeota archaeon]